MKQEPELQKALWVTSGVEEGVAAGHCECTKQGQDDLISHFRCSPCSPYLLHEQRNGKDIYSTKIVACFLLQEAYDIAADFCY